MAHKIIHLIESSIEEFSIKNHRHPEIILLSQYDYAQVYKNLIQRADFYHYFRNCDNKNSFAYYGLETVTWCPIVKDGELKIY